MAMTPGEYVRKLRSNDASTLTEQTTDAPAQKDVREALPSDPYSYPNESFLYKGSVLSTNEADLLYSKPLDDGQGRAFMFRCPDGREFMMVAPIARTPERRSLFYAAAFAGSFAMFLAHIGPILGLFFPLAVLSFFYGYHSERRMHEYEQPALQDVWEPDTPFDEGFIRAFETEIPGRVIQNDNGRAHITPKPLQLNLSDYGEYAFTENFIRLYNQHYAD